MTIGLAVLAGVLTVTLKARDAHAALETTARLQELARYALGLIESDVRMAGHLGLLARAELVANLRAPLTDPNGSDASPETAAKTVKKVADAITGQLADKPQVAGFGVFELLLNFRT